MAALKMGRPQQLFYNPMKKKKSKRKAKRLAIPVGALQTKHAAEYCSISIPTFRRAVKRGLLTPNRYFRHLLFPVSELDRFLREGMPQ